MRYLIIIASLSLFTISGCAEKKYFYARCNNESFYKKWPSKCEEHSSTETSAFSKVMIGIISAGIDSGIRNYQPPNSEGYWNSGPPPIGPIMPNIYGPGIGSDATGRAIK